ncbi:hypothetical protein IJS64_00235 [bacterium]|nr:hypothetical protein [bacterium]
MKCIEKKVYRRNSRLRAILFSIKESAEKNRKDPDMQEDNSYIDEFYRNAYIPYANELNLLVSSISFYTLFCRKITTDEKNVKKVFTICDILEKYGHFKICTAERLKNIEEELLSEFEDFKELTILKNK